MVLALGFALAATASAVCFWLYGNWYINMAWIFLGLTSEELLKKMSALRTYYGKEIGKERSSRTSGKGTKDVYVSKWHFFTSLHFLRDNITPRKTSSNMDTCISEEKENEAVGQDQPSQQATHHVSDDGSDQGSVFPTNNPPSVKNKKKRALAFEDELLSTCLEEMKRPKEDVTDADIVFGQYVSRQLKKIPEGYAKEMLKIEIQQSIVKVMLPVAQPLSNLVT